MHICRIFVTPLHLSLSLVVISLSSISSPTEIALVPAMGPTPSQLTLSTTEPTPPPVFQVHVTISFSSPSKNSQLSIVN